MIKANELRELTEKSIAEEIESRREKANKFCEELSKVLEERAKERFNFYQTEIPRNLKSYIFDVLKDNGYDVKFLNINTLAIYW